MGTFADIISPLPQTKLKHKELVAIINTNNSFVHWDETLERVLVSSWCLHIPLYLAEIGSYRPYTNDHYPG